MSKGVEGSGSAEEWEFRRMDTGVLGMEQVEHTGAEVRVKYVGGEEASAWGAKDGRGTPNYKLRPCDVDQATFHQTHSACGGQYIVCMLGREGRGSEGRVLCNSYALTLEHKAVFASLA